VSFNGSDLRVDLGAADVVADPYKLENPFRVVLDLHKGAAPPGEPEFESLGEALHDIEESMPNFARWLYRTVRADLGHRVADAGAGIGTYAELLLKDGRDVVALEYDGAFARELQRRFAGRGVSVFQSDLSDSAGLPEFEPVDSILCLNVLEHVEDDRILACQARRFDAVEGRVFRKVKDFEAIRERG